MLPKISTKLPLPLPLPLSLPLPRTATDEIRSAGRAWFRERRRYRDAGVHAEDGNRPYAGTETVRMPASLEWCEVIEKDCDPKVVTDTVLREAIVRTSLPWRVRDKSTGIEMLLVVPGQFTMGKSTGDAEALANEIPGHSVTPTQAFYLGRCEVTKEQLAKVVGGDARSGAKRIVPGVQGVQVDAGGGPTVIVSGGVGLVDLKGNPLLTRQIAEPGANGTVIFTTTPAEAGPAAAPDTRTGLPVPASWAKTAEFCRKAWLRLPTEAEW